MTKYMTPMFTLMTITMTTRLNSSDTSSGGVSVNQLEVTPGVSLMWGIADTTAVVGRLFSYHIPSDAFSGPVAGYKVLEAGRPCLPSWLHFISHLNVLRGLPTPTDAGSVYLEVHAIDVFGNNASDVFSIRISPDIFPMSAGDSYCMSMPDTLGLNVKLPTVCCKREESETIGSMVISADLPALSAIDRLKLVERFLNHTRMEGHAVKVVPATTEILQDAAALVTGSGDVDPWSSKLGSTSRVTAISWLVGCSKVEPKHLQLLQKLDDDASGGLMKRTLGQSVLGWHVTNSRLKEQQYYLKRKRRQIQATPTPDTPVVSTTTVWQSSSEATTTTENDEMDICVKPTVLEEIGVINMHANEYFEYRIQDSVFDACDRGGTSHTVLHLFREASKKLPANWFLKFDAKGQLICGLPLEVNVGDYKMTLVASLPDHATYLTAMELTLSVHKPRMGQRHMPSHELLTTIDYEYNEFTSDVDNLLNLSRKMATVLGSGDVESLTVLRLATGSVVYTFTNNTLSGPGCPVPDITMMADKLVRANGSLVQHAVEQVRPWILSAAAVRPLGDCIAVPHFPSRSTSTGPDGATHFGSFIATVVPCVIAAVVLLTLLITCFLCRNKRSGKFNLKFLSRLLSKRATVTFSDELDDRSDRSRTRLTSDTAASQSPAHNCRVHLNDDPALMTYEPGLTMCGQHDTDAAQNGDIEMNVISPAVIVDSDPIVIGQSLFHVYCKQ